jgi:dynein heavy chain
VSPAGLVENWLSEVEKTMRATIQNTIARAIMEYTDARDKWVMNWPGQVILVVSQIIWTKTVTKAIQAASANLQSLKTYYGLVSEQINQVVKLLRGDLSPLKRMALEALIVTDVHARDVVSSLIEAEVADENDFEWISKVRETSNYSF